MTRDQWRYTPIVLLVGLLGADWEPKDCPDCFHEGYRIEMPAEFPEPDPPPAVLFSGYRNGRCRDDLICTGVPDAWFGDLKGTFMNWWQSCGDQDREMVVFAGGHAPTVLKPPDTSTEFKPTLNNPAELRIAAWVEGADPNLENDTMVQHRLDDAADQLDRAKRTYDSLGAGIKLDYVLGTYPAKITTVLGGFLDDANCDDAAALRSATATDLLAMQDQDKLNVYFVRELHNNYGGVTCAGNRDPQSTRYMIFVSDSQHTPSTVAHEIGHALGLILYASLPNGVVGKWPGDINELDMSSYLAMDNLMFSGVGYVGQITLGEIYRMHFDKRSWLRRKVSETSEYPRECQASPEEGGLCPPLALHPTRGWP